MFVFLLVFLGRQECKKADPRNVNLPMLHHASYAGIIRIRFEGFRGCVPFSQPGIPSSPFSIVIIVFRRGKVKSPKACFLLFVQETRLFSVHFLFARAKRKWTKRESTPGEGISISLPLDPILETIQEGVTPS